MFLRQTIIASAIMILTAVCLGYLSQGESIPPKKPFSTFPSRIDGWVGREDHFDKKVYDILGVDDSVLYDYVSADGRQVQLYVGFYRSQREGDLIHSPKNCMPGAGWKIIHTSLESLTIADNDPKKVEAIKLVLEKAGQRQIVLYWFQARGRFVASEYWQKIYMVIDSITRHRTDEAFVRLITPVTGGNEDNALQRLKDFAEAAIPILNEYLPS